MPAAVNTFDTESSADTTLTTPGVTPGGANRAVLVGNFSAAAAEANCYSDVVEWDTGTTEQIDAYEGADIPFNVFDFVYGYAKTWGEAGSPNVATTISNAWPAAQYENCCFALFLEGTDQTAPYGAEQVSAQQFMDVAVAHFTDSRTGLTPEQFVVGFLYVFTVGDVGPSSYIAGGDVDTIIGASPGIIVEGKRLRVVAFSGSADVLGDFDVDIEVTRPDEGELVVCRSSTWPINAAAASPGGAVAGPHVSGNPIKSKLQGLVQ